MIRCSCGAELFSIESICSVCIPSKPPRALFVEDLRIKLANRELEILDWKEAVEIANAENDDLRREVAATTKHAQLLNKMLGEADARAERLEAEVAALRVTQERQNSDTMLLRQCYVTLAFAFHRLHESARSRDGELCLDFQRVRALIEKRFREIGIKL